MRPFRLERYFAAHEFSARRLLSPSDCESLAMSELLSLADAECRRLWQELRLGYTESAGHPLLRAEVARLHEHAGPDQVVIAAPEEAIYVCMHALLRPGDHVVCMSPAYQSLHEIAAALGCRVSPWPLVLADSGWRLDLDRLESLVSPETRLLIVNFPHNPTGFQPTPSEFASILEIARRAGCRVFSDEMYRQLEADSTDRLQAACDLYERAVSLQGLSKAYGLPGLRLGWLVSRERELPSRFLAVKDYTTICNGAPAEILGLVALRSAAAILERNRAIVRENREHAASFFAAHAGQLRWIPPLAGPVAFPQWRGDGDADSFCRAALDRCGILIVPGSLFDFPGGHFRIGLGRRDLPAALAELEPLLASPRSATTLL